MLFFVLSGKLVYANIDGYYAVVNDKDGYVNIRQKDNLNSPIVARLNNGIPVSANCTDDYVANKNFCFVIFGDGKYGFVYKNRLTFLTPNETFLKIPLTHISANKAEGVFSNQAVKINIQFAPANIDTHNFNKQPTKKFGIYTKIPNAKFYKIENIKVAINKHSIVLPDSAKKDIYLDYYFLSQHDEIANNMAVYQNKKDQHIYIIGRLADGAFMYSVIYEIKHGKYFRRSVWSEAI